MVVKGVGEDCKEANTQLDDGFLAIEKVNDMILVVFRMHTGKVPFRGVLSKAAAKTKILTEENTQKSESGFKLKFTVAVRSKDQEPKGYVVEHCVAKFLSKRDRDNFVDVYTKES